MIPRCAHLTVLDEDNQNFFILGGISDQFQLCSQVSVAVFEKENVIRALREDLKVRNQGHFNTSMALVDKLLEKELRETKRGKNNVEMKKKNQSYL